MGEIALKATFSAPVQLDKVRRVLNSALGQEADLAQTQRAYFEHACQAFEQQYQMSSEEFLLQFEAGSLGDQAPYFDWYAAKRGLDVWGRRYRILSGIAA